MNQDRTSATPEEDIMRFCGKYGVGRQTVHRQVEKVLYTELRFALEHVYDPDFLPVLEAALRSAGDADLRDDATGTNALMWAVGSDRVNEMLTMLWRVRPEWVQANIRQTDANGRTPLHHLACGWDDDPKNIHLLLEWGVPLDARSKNDGRSALHEHAIRNSNDSNERRIDALLSHKPAIYCDFDGNDPAYYEWNHGHGDRERAISDYALCWVKEKRKEANES